MAESSKVVHANGSATVTTTVSSNHATAADPSSKMEFTYFAINRGGRGLGIKCCLFKAGLAFDDVQLTFEEFGKAKKEGKYACGLPQLKLPNGKVFTQSFAILRYAGKLAGLYPEDPEQALACDVVMDVVFDLMAKVPGGDTPDVKKKAREEYAATKMKNYTDELSRLIDTNPGTFAVGNSITIADLALFFYTDCIMTGNFDHVDKGYLSAWPSVVAVDALIRKDPVVTNFLGSVGETTDLP